MRRPLKMRLRILLVALAAMLMLSGCPGQFPTAPDRNAPPKGSRKGISSSGPYFHGGLPPGVQDTSD